MRTWIALHPDWYVRERRAMAARYPAFLSSDAELAHGRLVYAGELTVDLGGAKRRHAVLLLYTPGSPYQWPHVYPLKELPVGVDWTASSVASELGLRMPTGFRRHQMSDLRLCLAESDSFHTEDQVSGPDLLWRAHQIFKAIDLGRPFPFPDSIDAELEAHVTAVADVLLPEVFYEPFPARRGTFFAFRYPDREAGLPNSILSREKRSLFLGAAISTETDSGITLGAEDAAGVAIRRLLPWLSDVQFTFQGVVAEPQIAKLAMEGRWFELQQEPEPVLRGVELEALLRDAGTEDPGGVLSWAVQKKGLLAFRFPARTGQKVEWIMLCLLPREETDTPEVRAEPGALRDIARGAIVLGFRVHKLERRDLEFRNGPELIPLSDKRVLLLGAGALGGDVAVTLGKAGVGRLDLVDFDRMRTGNSIRHVSPILAAGLLKTEAVRHEIWSHNPFVDVRVTDFNVTEDLAQLEALLSDCDLAVSTIADESVEMLVNEAAMRVGCPVLYGRALRGGSAGRLFKVRPGVDACKRCLAIYAASGGATGWVDVPEKEGEVIGRECGNPILAGSAADLRFVADLISRAVLDELSTGSTHNMILWSREPLDVATGLRDGNGLVRQQFGVSPECPVCRRPSTVRIVLAEDARRAIVAATEAKPSVETGGILIGFSNENGEVVVMEATDAGPNAVESRSRFERDTPYCQNRLNDAVKRLAERGQYVGEWHSHLEASPRPSARDIESLVGIAEAPNYLTAEPIMLIAGLNPATARVEEIHGSCFPIAARMIERDVVVRRES